MTACRAAPSPRALSISCCRRRRSPPRSSSASAAETPTPSPDEAASAAAPASVSARDHRRCCARRPFTTSRLYKHGTLERRVERRMAMAAIDQRGRLSRPAAARRRRTRRTLPRLADQCHRVLSRSGGIRISGRRTSFPVSCAITRRIGRCESGSPGAVPARRPIRSRFCFASRSSPRSARSNCRFSPATSIPTPSRARGRASIPNRSRPMSRRRDWRSSSRGKIAPTASRRNCAPTSCSRCRIVLADPPFARLDFISCRNLLIYLQPEAQAKASRDLPFRPAGRRPAAGRQRRDRRLDRRPV